MESRDDQGRARVSRLLRYLYTLRYLQPRQVAARLWFRLHRPRPDLRAAPPVRALAGLYQAPIEPQPTLVAPWVFRFLHTERRCLHVDDWQPADVDRLWTYNLHYFDDLNAEVAVSRRGWHHDLLERWVAENPPGQGAGWEPYPLSRRIVNWIKWELRGSELPAACRSSLAVQARWLLGRLEYHLLGNHLCANAKALVYAGLFFAGREAEGWYSRGMRILERELRDQVLADGGHFERSTMYHAIVLEDLLDLVNLLRACGRSPPPGWYALIARMRRWLEVMTHPDGEIAFFNDAAFRGAASSAQLTAYAGRLGLERVVDPRETLVVLAPSGYVRGLAGPAYLVCDCAPVGPDHQPGHAHADTLSFELSVSGRRILVNSGTARYGSDAERGRQRGTAAHNTVVVDESDSSEVWAGFRVARRARALLAAAQATPQGVLIEGCHDGYRRLAGRNVHYRQWRLDGRSLRLEDRVSGSFRSAAARFHVHPQLAARMSGTNAVTLVAANGAEVRMSFEPAASVQVVASTWHPEFGVAEANSCVVARFAGDTLRTHVAWAPEP